MFFYKLNSLHTIHVHVYQPIAIIIKLSRNKLLSFDMCNKPDKNVVSVVSRIMRYKYYGNTAEGTSSVHSQSPVDHSRCPLDVGTS